jgi:hypothetical protein
LVATLLLALSVAIGAASALADGPPTVTIDPPTNAGYRTVDVSGTVNPNGGPSETAWFFEYSEDEVSWFGGLWHSAGSGTDPVPAEDTLENLQPGTTYHLRLAAEKDGVKTFSPTPNPEFTTLDTTPPSVTIGEVTNVTATTAHFEGTVNPGDSDPAFDVNWRFECSPGCPGFLGGSLSADTSDHTVEADAEGLDPNTDYEVTLVAENSGEQASDGPKSFTTEAIAPVAQTVPAFAGDNGTTALLGGQVDANGSATNYWFEYGPDAGYGSSVPASQDASAGSAVTPQFVTQQIGGLAPGTRYHYRVVAKNSEGTASGDDLTFETAPAETAPACPNEALRNAFTEHLTDCRGFEQVSPVNKNNSDAYWANAMASASGDKITWTSQGSFAGQPTAHGVSFGNYMSSRTSGSWQTRGYTPPNAIVNFEAGFYGFTEDLSKGYMAQREAEGDTLEPGVPGGYNLYLANNLDGTYQYIGKGRGEGGTNASGFVWATPSLDQIVFDSANHLTDDSPCNNDGVCAYEWDRGQLRLVSVLPGEVPAQGNNGGGGPDWQFRTIDNAISNDGRRVFFKSGGELYVRQDHSTTTLVSASERTSPGGAEGSSTEYLGAEAAHGNRVLFSTSDWLVDAEDSGGLYLYDFTAPAGERLTLLSKDLNPESPSGSAFLGVVSRSSNMRQIWFAAENQILPGEVEVPGPKLYRWDDNGGDPQLSYVGPLEGGDAILWREANVSFVSGNKPARVSPNGRYTTFRSQARLTAFDNEDQEEIYLFDSATRELRCVSCTDDAFPAQGYVGYDATALFGLVMASNHPLRNLSDQGRLFFETKRGLLPEDSNGKIDVYEYEAGRLHLLSPGTGSGDSRFLDASTTGDDAFFVTGEQLVAWDDDDNIDVYDAKVNGGLPEPPPTGAACEGDACQPPPVVPNDPTPSSSGFKGPESPKPKFKKKRHCHAKKQKRGKRRCHSKKHGPGKKHKTHRHG